jgi:serine/threonine protein kinase
MDDLALNLLDTLLTLNPEKRLTAKEALNHSFFKSEPLPCEPSQ